jgi:hypothetical protein
LVGQDPEQLEQLVGRGSARQRDLADVVELEALQQPRQPFALVRHAAHVEPATAHSQRERRVLEHVEDCPELRFLSLFRDRITKQAQAVRKSCCEGLEGRHRGGSI